MSNPVSTSYAARGLVPLLMVSVSLSCTANNFAGRIKAEILGEYNFVTVVPDSAIQFGFNAVVLTILMLRHKVHRSQFEYLFHWGRSWAELGGVKYLVLASINDIANNVTGLAAQPYLTTLMMSLTDQATTPFTVFFSLLLLGTRYIALEVGCVILIMLTAVLCVFAKSGSDGENSEFWAIFAALTTSFAALSFVLKEIVFNAYKEFSCSTQAANNIQLPQSRKDYRLHQSLRQPLSIDPEPPERGSSSETGASDNSSRSDSTRSSSESPIPLSLSVFLVGTIINFVGLLVSVPLALLNHVATSPTPALPALRDGLQALFEREHALTAYIVYISINTLFNLSLILTTCYGSALLSFLSIKVAVPLTALLSPIPWPIIGAHKVSATLWLLLCVMIGGIVGFRSGNMRRMQM